MKTEELRLQLEREVYEVQKELGWHHPGWAWAVQVAWPDDDAPPDWEPTLALSIRVGPVDPTPEDIKAEPWLFYWTAFPLAVMDPERAERREWRLLKIRTAFLESWNGLLRTAAPILKAKHDG